MERSINNPALSLWMKHLVISQRLKAPKFSAFHWSPHSSLVSIGQNFVSTRVVHLPKRTETSLITESDLITSFCSYERPAQPGPIRTRLCGPCIAALAGFLNYSQVIKLSAICVLGKCKEVKRKTLLSEE